MNRNRINLERGNGSFVSSTTSKKKSTLYCFATSFCCSNRTWLLLTLFGFGILTFSFVLVWETNFKAVCHDNISNEKEQKVTIDLTDYSLDLYWVQDPPVYAENETWVKGWFPEKELPDGQLNVTPQLANQSFFWQCFNKYYKDRWVADNRNALNDLAKWLLIEPAVDFNRSCLPPPLIKPENLRCKEMHPYANFTGEIRKKPRKIGISFKYAFETDVLELQLMEVYDVVDKIFLVESCRTHMDNSPKRLFWEELKWTTRFRKFQDKVVHFILDDHDVVQTLVVGEQEHYQEKVRFEMIVEWNRKFKFFEDDDLIAMGDCDEIVSRNVIHALKYCEIENLSVGIDAGIWFVHQSIQSTQIGYASLRVFSQYCLGSPTFHSFARCNASYDKGIYLTREKGRNKGHAIAGGIHLSWYPNPFQLLMKRVTCSECVFKGQIAWTNFTDLAEFTDWLIHSPPWDTFWLKYPLHEVRGTGDPTEYYPWAMVCNPYRYRASVFLTNDERLFYSKDQIPFDKC